MQGPLQVRCGDDGAWVATVQQAAPGWLAADWQVAAELRSSDAVLVQPQPLATWVDAGAAVRVHWPRSATAVCVPGVYRLALRFERKSDGYTHTTPALALTVVPRL